MNWLTQLLTFKKRTTPKESIPENLSPQLNLGAQTEVEENLIEKNKLENQSFENPILNYAELVPNPDWMDEEAIRDEGVIYGLTQTPPESKREAIRAHFARLSAPFQAKFEDLAQEIHGIDNQIAEVEKRISHFISEKNELMETPTIDHHFLRIAAGLIFSVGMSFGNFFLIDESIKNTYPVNHVLISIGVFLAGMFSLFQTKSVLHDTQKSVSFRNLLEEIGLPFSASFFVFVQVYSVLPLLESVALFLLSFFLFLFTGKLLLGQLSIIRKEWDSWQQNRTIQRKLRKIQSEEKEIIQASREEITELQSKRKILSDKQSEEQQKLEALRQQMESLLQLFQSEYDLATTFLSKKDGTNSSLSRY
ncbi:MAG: hypothetical protein ACK4R6_06760 [Spirosomataceae bacterium]